VLGAVTAALVGIAFAGEAQAGPTFEVDLWPGEGRPVIESVAFELELREGPSGSSRHLPPLAVRPGQRLSFDQTRYRTTRPGRLEVRAPTVVAGRNLGSRDTLSSDDYYRGEFARTTVTLEPGDSVEYLQYRAEGTCFVRIAGVVIDAEPCPAEHHEDFRLGGEPTIEWWIRLVRDEKPLGWLRVTDATAKVVDRAF
jgi:hypothetical protein